MLRQNEADLINQIRHAQDPDRFSKMTEAGSRLSQQQAVAPSGADTAPARPTRTPAPSLTTRQGQRRGMSDRTPH